VKLKSKVKNTILAGLAGLTLTACGGGGGGGAIAVVEDFVQEDLTNLVGSESIINSYSNLLSGFSSTISSGNFASLSSLVTDPNDEDISKANSLLSMLDQAETLWTQTLTLIDSQDADTKLSIYSSDDYKNAHASLLYLKNHVKPIMTKVSQGQKLSLTEYQKVASDAKAHQLIKQEKDTIVEDYVTQKKNKINEDKQQQEQNEQTEEESTEEESTEEESTEEESTEEESTEEESTEEESTEEESTEEPNEQVSDPWQGIEGKKQYLGTKTANFNSDKTTYETTEYNSNHGLNTINAADAYARGWTGKGAVLGVIDTWQDTDHENLDGKYLYYKNYDPYNGTVVERQWHGTHVASIIAGNKTGDSYDANGRLTTGDYTSTQKWLNGSPVTEYSLVKNNNTHGVAFDAKLVGANIDRHSNARISINQAQLALHDFAKLKSAESNGGEGMNIVAVNMSFNNSAYFKDYTDHDNDPNTQNQWTSTVTQLNDGTYKASELVEKMAGNNGQGDSRYWKVATDSDIILVNSAGNTGYAHAGDPGIWAVEEDSNGNLILGGKMVIVGNWNGTEVEGNKAGHVCLKINTSNNTCNDTHRISDFYILAPGYNIMAATPNGAYNNGSGTSMAAPHVTGAFGVLNQMWPYMAGDNLVKLVMNTADKTMFGNDYNVNVHGQGMLDLNEATKPQGAVGLATSGRVDHPTVSLNTTYYSTGTALPSNLSNLKIMVLDDYDRNYYMDLGSSFVVQDKRKFSDVQMLVENKDTFLPHNQMYGSFTQGGNYDLAKNYNFGLYTGENGSGDYSLNVGKDFYINNKFKLKTSLGHMSEQDTWLGNSSDGVLAVGDNNDTTSANIGVAYQLGNNVLTLDYSKGFTDVNTTDNSLIKSFSDIETESYRLAYEIHKDTHTTFGWSFSLPSHITSGTMDLEVAESVNLDGTINYTDINSDLAQGTKEKNIGFYYNKSGEEELDASFNFTAEYRMDKSGVANNDGVEVGMSFVKKFAGSCKFLWMKNPKCFDKDGNMKYNLFGKTLDNNTKHGLVYDLKTDKFVPIKK